MIEINLIEKKKSFKAPVILGVDIAKLNWKMFIIIYLVFQFVPDEINKRWEKEREEETKKFGEIQRKLKKLRKTIELNATVKEKLNAFNSQLSKLEKRSDQVDEIIKQRTNPKEIFEKVARNTPDDLWFEKINISERKIVIEGGSQSFESIGRFISKINETPYFEGSLKMVDSKTISEKIKGQEIRSESFKIEGAIKVFDTF
jgi:hypothetical protein